MSARLFFAPVGVTAMSSTKPYHISTRDNEPRKQLGLFVKSCRAFELSFVKVPSSAIELMLELSDLSRYGFDHIFCDDDEPYSVHLSDKLVRMDVMSYLKEVEGTIVSIMKELAILIEENRRDQNKVRAIGEVVKQAHRNLREEPEECGD
jgi:hypothetical protein